MDMKTAFFFLHTVITEFAAQTIQNAQRLSGLQEIGFGTDIPRKGTETEPRRLSAESAPFGTDIPRKGTETIIRSGPLFCS